MRKISLSFAFMLTILCFVSFSCQDHQIPQNPPQIETLGFEFLPGFVSAPTGAFVLWQVNFTDLGDIGITEYGIVYSIESESQTANTTPEVNGTSTTLVPFSSEPVGNEVIKNQGALEPFSKIYYRAYAKLVNGKVVYGDILN